MCSDRKINQLKGLVVEHAPPEARPKRAALRLVVQRQTLESLTNNRRLDGIDYAHRIAIDSARRGAASRLLSLVSPQGGQRCRLGFRIGEAAAQPG